MEIICKSYLSKVACSVRRLSIFFLFFYLFIYYNARQAIRAFCRLPPSSPKSVRDGRIYCITRRHWLVDVCSNIFFLYRIQRRPRGDDGVFPVFCRLSTEGHFVYKTSNISPPNPADYTIVLLSGTSCQYLIRPFLVRRFFVYRIVHFDFARCIFSQTVFYGSLIISHRFAPCVADNRPMDIINDNYYHCRSGL